VSDCDSPIALINKTIEWIGKELRDEIDFVIWTGDSARHDNDEDHPRTAEQVTELNEFMVQKMFEVFGKHNGDEEDRDPNNDFIIPIVPNIGNNDILPHNIMTKGPNRWTRSFLTVWRQFIPEVQKHSFEQGGWFSVDVIPNKLAVFSLNTMYFFQSNAAVDGCAARSEPGYRQMEWLRIQLQFMRDRGMKAIMIGHVPPARTDAKTQWDETCWQKYTLWMQQYRDVVIAGMWGHMNYDHFMLQDFHAIADDTNGGRMKISQLDAALRQIPDDEMHAEVSSSYFTDLRKQWSTIPKPPKSLRQTSAAELMESSDDQRPMWEIDALLDELSKGGNKKKGDGKSKKQRREEQEKKYLKDVGGRFAERYSVSFASASVVPNLLPVVRIYEYNISGLESHHLTALHAPTSIADLRNGLASDDVPTDEDAWETWLDDIDDDDNSWVDTLRKKRKDQKFTVPKPPSKSSPPGPAYSPQTLTLLGYKQYLANLTHINNDFANSAISATEDELVGSGKWNEGKHKGKKPHEHDEDHKPNPKTFQFELHYDTRNDSVYNLPDLTIRSMLGLARDIGTCEPKPKTKTLAAADDNEDEDDDDDDEDDETEDIELQKKKKHKGSKKGKKKHGKKHKKCQKNEAWHTFIRRAFVETLDPDEIAEEFGN
jgi:endopolyphosphatase